MVLEKEREFFEKKKPELLKQYRNLFVLIKGDQLIGAFPNAESAYQEGLNSFGLEPFLVKQVLENEPIGVIPILSVVTKGAGL